ncbi:MAG: hypothetical protein V2I41_16205 [Pseudomonadales bacterium]|nr:hypothetical protein [Pseudomonadales bacterium]
MTLQHASYAEQLEISRPTQRAHMFMVYYRTFVTADGFQGDLDDHSQGLTTEVEQLISAQSSEYWENALRAAGFSCFNRSSTA